MRARAFSPRHYACLRAVISSFSRLFLARATFCASSFAAFDIIKRRAVFFWVCFRASGSARGYRWVWTLFCSFCVVCRLSALKFVCVVVWSETKNGRCDVIRATVSSMWWLFFTVVFVWLQKRNVILKKDMCSNTRQNIGICSEIKIIWCKLGSIAGSVWDMNPRQAVVCYMHLILLIPASRSIWRISTNYQKLILS